MATVSPAPAAAPVSAHADFLTFTAPPPAVERGSQEYVDFLDARYRASLRWLSDPLPHALRLGQQELLQLRDFIARAGGPGSVVSLPPSLHGGTIFGITIVEVAAPSYYEPVPLDA